jgi:hypothetical protein
MSWKNRAPNLCDADSGYKKRQTSDVHHLMPKSRGGTNSQNNLKEMHVSAHRAVHKLFGVLTPIEQQLFLAMKLNETVLTKRFQSELAELLLDEAENPDYYYKN